MAEIVEPKASQSNRSARRLPDAAVEIAAPQRPSIGVGEDEARWLHPDQFVEVLLQFRHDVWWDCDRSPTCVCLRWPEDMVSVGELLDLPDDPHRRAPQVDVVPGQCGELTETETAPGGQEDHGSEPRVDCLSQRLLAAGLFGHLSAALSGHGSAAVADDPEFSHRYPARLPTPLGAESCPLIMTRTDPSHHAR
jgi:hypothetical protein